MTVSIEYEAEKKLDLPYEKIIKEIVEASLDFEKCPYEAEVNVILTDNVHPAKCGNALAGRGGLDNIGSHNKSRKQPQNQSHQQDYQHINNHGKLDGVLDSLHKQPRCEQAEEHRCRLILPVSQQQHKGNHRHRDHKGGVAI